jgi:predicted DNA-binding transcriptional regulator AlpA
MEHSQRPALPVGDRFVRASEFYKRLGVSKSKFYASVKAGKLPQPIKLSVRGSAWPQSEVEKVIQAIAAGECLL